VEQSAGQEWRAAPEDRLAEGLADFGGEAQLGNCKQRIEATCAPISRVGRKALRNQISTVDS
jgi:hypothetical protein